jgi:hypothetical protein
MLQPTIAQHGVGCRRRVTGAKEEQMASVKDEEILVRDESFVKYDRLLEKAMAEGRIDGPHKCLTCGMRFKSKEEAEDCCKPMF